MADSISDFITNIRNASKAHNPSCDVKHSKLHWSMAEKLKSEGFIRDIQESKDKNAHNNITITLKYIDETPVITDIQRSSKPGRRIYYKANDIPKVLGGLGISILSTSKGILKDKEARRENVGGEVLCTVW